MQNPPTPFLGPIADGFGDGRMIRIQGTTAPNASRFNVNIQSGPAPTDDIALHISVRMLEGYVARNSYSNGSWGEEQGDGKLPIGPGQAFEIIILSAAKDYKIAINGRHFAEFPHRVSPTSVNHLSIDGDVALKLISYEGGAAAPGGDQHSRSTSTQQMSQGYGPPPPQPGYGSQPPQGYGPPPPQRGYGPPPGAYGPPSPPGHQPEQESGGFGNFLEQAQSVIAGAVTAGLADKLIESLTHKNDSTHRPARTPSPPPPPPPSSAHREDENRGPPIHMPMFGGGGSVGGLGSIGGLLGSLAGQLLQPPKKDDHHQGHH